VAEGLARRLPERRVAVPEQRPGCREEHLGNADPVLQQRELVDVPGIPAVAASQYLRLRGTNLPRSTPWETDADGNPLPDLYTNQAGYAGTPENANLKITCNSVGNNVPDNGTLYKGTGINGCPNHLPVVNGQKYSAFDVAAWADLWVYSNPIFIEVAGSTRVAGVK
jgi:hypothetical protein